MKNIRSILATTDLTGASDHVVRAAGAIANLTGAQLHVLHAFESEAKPYATSQKPVTFQTQIAEAKHALDEQITRTLQAPVQIASRDVIIYTAFKAIRDRAKDVRADLIVLGRHRRHPIGDTFLGATADRVIRSVDVPCLIVHGNLSLPLRRVVVPIDLSEPALAALDVALNWSALLSPSNQQPEIIVLHVIPRVYSTADVPIDQAGVGADLARQVAAAHERIGSDVAPIVREEIRWGDATSEEINSFAQEGDADLIVMGTHGHGAFKRAIVGSVATGVARTASTPLLLVPPALWQTD